MRFLHGQEGQAAGGVGAGRGIGSAIAGLPLQDTDHYE
jgi:hypothetical protein